MRTIINKREKPPTMKRISEMERGTVFEWNFNYYLVIFQHPDLIKKSKPGRHYKNINENDIYVLNINTNEITFFNINTEINSEFIYEPYMVTLNVNTGAKEECGDLGEEDLEE